MEIDQLLQKLKDALHTWTDGCAICWSH